MGRPERLTRERHEKFIQAIRTGCFPEVAARFAGFAPATFYRYMHGTTPAHAAFRDAVLKAQTELEVRLVGIITREALTKPRWAMESPAATIPRQVGPWGSRRRGGARGDG